ncbi:MAG TPA: hypothetical protein VHN98_07985 [Acidimicrobiales bacterium]|nr:hypothetical protein [Acidimicrobiales bacterium]
MRPAPTIDPLDSLTVRPWPDDVIDSVGHHPCSVYVETFWTGVLGPSSTLLLRHLSSTLDAFPDGFDLPLGDTARRLGLGDKGGRHSVFVRAVQRLVQFEMAEMVDTRTLAVRRRIPPLSRRHLARLPELLQVAHRHWQEVELRTPPLERMRRRSRQLALSYLEAGLDLGETERELMRLGYHPSVCYESARWAIERHETAVAASISVLPPPSGPVTPARVQAPAPAMATAGAAAATPLERLAALREPLETPPDAA